MRVRERLLCIERDSASGSLQEDPRILVLEYLLWGVLGFFPILWNVCRRRSNERDDAYDRQPPEKYHQEPAKSQLAM